MAKLFYRTPLPTPAKPPEPVDDYPRFSIERFLARARLLYGPMVLQQWLANRDSYDGPPLLPPGAGRGEWDL